MKREKTKLVRKKTILDFNHIDPSLPEEKLEEIQKLYATYKRLWWCFKKVYQKQKLLDLAEKNSFLSFGCGRSSCWRRESEPSCAGSDLRIGVDSENNSGSKKQGKED